MSTQGATTIQSTDVALTFTNAVLKAVGIERALTHEELRAISELLDEATSDPERFGTDLISIVRNAVANLEPFRATFEPTVLVNKNPQTGELEVEYVEWGEPKFVGFWRDGIDWESYDAQASGHDLNQWPTPEIQAFAEKASEFVKKLDLAEAKSDA